MLNHTGGTPAVGVNVSTLSWNHTVNDFKELLVVGVCCDSGATVSSITFGGASLTVQTTYNAAVEYEIWTLSNPSVGTAMITVTFSVACNSQCGALNVKAAQPADESKLAVTGLY